MEGRSRGGEGPVHAPPKSTPSCERGRCGHVGIQSRRYDRITRAWASRLGEGDRNVRELRRRHGNRFAGELRSDAGPDERICTSLSTICSMRSSYRP